MSKNRLNKSERCPIHNSFFCCGRERLRSKKYQYRQHIRALPDGRVVCSQAELTRRKKKLLRDHPFCAACEVLDPENARFADFRDVHLAHMNSKGHGGGKHDDSWPNLRLMHAAENIEMGSRSFERYISDKLEKRRKESEAA